MHTPMLCSTVCDACFFFHLVIFVVIRNTEIAQSHILHTSYGKWHRFFFFCCFLFCFVLFFLIHFTACDGFVGLT